MASKILAIFLFIFLSGCQKTLLKDRLVDIQDFYQSCPAIAETVLQEHLRKSFIEGDLSGREQSYNSATVAKEFLSFAIASENAYLADNKDENSTRSDSRSGYQERFILEKYDQNWKFQEREVKAFGLAYDYYFDDHNPNIFKVMVAYRGSETQYNDWVYGNFFPDIFGQSQHRLAEFGFNQIRSKALQNAHGKPIYYFTTGHSLGGALARHIAEAYPCVSAIVFNSSPVTRAAQLDPRSGGNFIIDIVENHDELRFLSNLFFSFDDTHKGYYSFDTLNLNEFDGSSDHSLTGIAVGMARMAADCLKNNVCHMTDDQAAKDARSIYCSSDWSKNDNVCQ